MQEPRVYCYELWTFTIGDRITIENYNQRIYLSPKEHYWKKHLNFVRALIEMGEIQNYDDLVKYCRGKVDLIYTNDQPKRQLEYK